MSYGNQYKQIWTKEPHGGAYRKAGDASGGYDALVQHPDRTLIKREPGYEKPVSGPTSNFVGNHMTQGAIDLVQSDLQRGKPEKSKTGQRVILATPLVMSEFGGGVANATAAGVCVALPSCATPAGAAEHLRRVRSAVIRARDAQ